MKRTIPRLIDTRTRTWTIIAQDPGIRDRDGIVTTDVEIGSERLAPGPRGYRVHVVDFDSTFGTLYKPAALGRGLRPVDRYKNASDKVLLRDPAFHAQNVYAIVMRTLERFEMALGRHVSWAFYGHQIHVAPHAFSEANAYYSPEDHGLLFGYFLGRKKRTIFSCLSHDVIVHETTHALLDGLRPRYTDPSLPDQAAFHEGYGDLVALLSVFSLPDVLECLIETSIQESNRKGAKLFPDPSVPANRVDSKWLRTSAVFRMADEMGKDLSQRRGEGLRQSAELKHRKGLLDTDEFQEPHRRGEVLVAATLEAMIDAWVAHFRKLTEGINGPVTARQIATAGSAVADYLLTVVIRALDYAPPIDMFFGDFLSAALTAEHEMVKDGNCGFDLRKRLLESFTRWDIQPTSDWHKVGLWLPPEREAGESLEYSRIHLESLKRDPDEVFRFLWENRKQLDLDEGAYLKVLSVRPSVRVGEDGFVLNETIAEYMQEMEVGREELPRFWVDPPQDMPRDARIRLMGGGTLIFDEFGCLKYHVHKRIRGRRQNRKIQYLWSTGTLEEAKKVGFGPAYGSGRSFAALHRSRGG